MALIGLGIRFFYADTAPPSSPRTAAFLFARGALDSHQMLRDFTLIRNRFLEISVVAYIGTYDCARSKMHANAGHNFTSIDNAYSFVDVYLHAAIEH